MKKPIAEEYEEQYEKLLNKIGDKLFKGNTKLGKYLFDWFNVFLKDENLTPLEKEHCWLRLMIGDINIIKESKIMYDIISYTYIVFNINNLINQIKIRMNKIDEFKDELTKVYLLINRLLYEKTMINKLWANENVYILTKTRKEQDNTIRKIAKDYEETLFKFSNYPKWIEINEKIVEDFIKINNYFDNQNWGYLEYIFNNEDLQTTNNLIKGV